jgi:nitronate monooxygenase
VALPPLLRDSLRLPVIGAPMFIASTPDLVIEQCKAGIVGSFPALNARPASQLDEWLARIKAELDAYAKANPTAKVAPFAVNQICHASNDRLMHDVEACVRHKVPLIITSLRPPREIVEAAHSYGGLVFHDVISLRHARKAAEQGVDGIIAVCAGAGGHAGMASPFALVREIRQFFDGTIALSGAMSSGADVFAAQALGVSKELGFDAAKVNPNGGAVALGHPIGASGARVLTTLLHALRRTGRTRGVATLCLGGGNAVAMAVESL